MADKTATLPLDAWHAAPFWASFTLVPLLIFAAIHGGWTIAIVPLAAWWLSTALDTIAGQSHDGADPDSPDSALLWYRLATLIWPIVQFVALFGLIAYVAPATHLALWEKVALFFATGVVTGTIGINYSHELMHQSGRFERWLGDILLSMVLYSHFRSEHLLVHHVHVGTPRDPVTARYNEGFHRFFARVIWQVPLSAWHAEKAKLARKRRGVLHPDNPFWRYAGLQAIMLGLAFGLGGWLGLGLFMFQALAAIWQLELVNYVEHYGLTRLMRDTGRYEPVRPHHSWNADHRATNWLLINLQRHSDHHYKPNRRFPLLQTYPEAEAPQLPFGYPLMTMAAMVPPLWRRVMNPKVRAWRRQFYPQVTDWSWAQGRAMALPDLRHM